MSLWWVPVLLGLASSPWLVLRSPAAGADRVAVQPQVRLDPAVLADLLGVTIASGAPVPEALLAVGRSIPGDQGRRVARIAALLRLGSAWNAAWDDAGDELAEIGAALRPAWEDGVAPETLLAHVARQVRQGRADAARDAAARLGVRLVLPMGLCWLPAFVLIGLAPVVLSAGALWQ